MGNPLNFLKKKNTKVGDKQLNDNHSDKIRWLVLQMYAQIHIYCCVNTIIPL